MRCPTVCLCTILHVPDLTGVGPARDPWVQAKALGFRLLICLCPWKHWGHFERKHDMNKAWAWVYGRPCMIATTKTQY